MRKEGMFPLHNPPEIIQVQSATDIIMWGAMIDDPPPRSRPNYRHRLSLAQCDAYLKSVKDGHIKKPSPERQQWWNYYGRDYMITCEVERGNWKYNNPTTYYRMKLW